MRAARPATSAAATPLALLRFATGHGTALPFLIVAALALLLLVGWRAAASSLVP